MDENDWDDEDEEYYDQQPYVIVEQQESGIGPFLLGIALGAGVALLFAPQSGQEVRSGLGRSARRAQTAALVRALEGRPSEAPFVPGVNEVAPSLRQEFAASGWV